MSRLLSATRSLGWRGFVTEAGIRSRSRRWHRIVSAMTKKTQGRAPARSFPGGAHGWFRGPRQGARDRLSHRSSERSARARWRLGRRGPGAHRGDPHRRHRLDVALGIGGLPRGRVVEIYGPESCGKTTVALHAVANAQRAGGIAGVHRRRARARPRLRRRPWASTPTRCWSRSPTPVSRRSRSPTCWSAPARSTSSSSTPVAALVPRAEIEGEMGDSHVGLQARLMSQALRKITGALNQLEAPPRSSSTSCARRSA